MKLRKFLNKSKNVALGTVLALTSSVSAFASPATGNTDLDTLITSMEEGTNTIKTGGMYIVALIIVIAVVFYGARWLWSMWRSWMSRAN